MQQASCLLDPLAWESSSICIVVHGFNCVRGGLASFLEDVPRYGLIVNSIPANCTELQLIPWLFLNMVILFDHKAFTLWAVIWGCMLSLWYGSLTERV